MGFICVQLFVYLVSRYSSTRLGLQLTEALQSPTPLSFIVKMSAWALGLCGYRPLAVGSSLNVSPCFWQLYSVSCRISSHFISCHASVRCIQSAVGSCLLSRSRQLHSSAVGSLFFFSILSSAARQLPTIGCRLSFLCWLKISIRTDVCTEIWMQYISACLRFIVDIIIYNISCSSRDLCMSHSCGD